MKTPHVYRAGTRLSNAYTLGRDGLPFAPHLGNKSSAAYKAYLAGKADLRLAAKEARKEMAAASIIQRLTKEIR